MSKTSQLRDLVCEANIALSRASLAPLTWGNVSGISADRRHVAIKPSGVPYDRLRTADIVVVDIEGRIIEGNLRPSTDTPTHLALYRAFPHIGGITHTHSTYATMFAQARRPVPCMGTTHADHFCGEVPVTRQLSAEEVAEGYEAATGAVIVERFASEDPVAVPGVLVAGHAPFVWGSTPTKSVENAAALEAICHMAFGTLLLGSDVKLEAHLLAKHHERKHGRGAYYGQIG